MSSPNKPGSPNPTRPLGITSPRSPRDERAALDDERAALNAALQTPGLWAGTPPPNIPPRNVTSPRPNSFSPSGAAFPASRDTPSGRQSPAVFDVPSAAFPSTPQDLEEVPDEHKAKVLRRHLVSRDERDNMASSPSSLAAFPRDQDVSEPGTSGDLEDDAEFPVPYSKPGGDITHGIYKWQSDARRDALRRARSISLAPPPVTMDPSFQHIREPGGFRRNYLLLRANEQGTELPPMSNNFIDFLYLFGHFGGEDLEEDEDEDEEVVVEGEEVAVDDEARPLRVSGPSRISEAEEGLRGLQHQSYQSRDPSKAFEGSRLVSRLPSHGRDTSGSRRRRRSVSRSPGDASVGQAVLMLLKSFIGTGILFLGKAFYNGGMLFSTITLAFIAMISLYSFILLVKTKFVVSGSFGDIGGTLYGSWMRMGILSSIVLSQLGFCAAYTIFVASNLQSLIMTIVLLPLSLVRNLAKLSGTALIADVFILIGIGYIASNEVALIARQGIADVALFNPKSFPLLIGTAVFSFEGVGLVIPITDAMREPRKFPAALSGVMVSLMFLFGGAGVLSYAAYGSSVEPVIFVNLPQDQPAVRVVQFLYSIAILLSAPLQLFPALRIMENAFFTKSGKTNLKIKWEKNAFRASMVFICYLLAWFGAADLDKFVSFIGSFACIPLCYVYPAMLHYKACARTRLAKAKDIALMIFGLAATIFTTVQTIKLTLEPSKGSEPEFGCLPAQPDGSTPLQILLRYLGL